jgi:hypothetical protein
MLPFVTENALPKFADRERGPTPYDFDQKFSRSGKSYREVELSPSVASLGQPRRITRQTTLKHSIPKFTLYVSGRARCSSSEAVRLNGKTGRRPKAASWRVGKAPPNLRYRRRWYPVTPTQLFNRPVRACFPLGNPKRRSSFPVSHTVKNSGC